MEFVEAMKIITRLCKSHSSNCKYCDFSSCNNERAVNCQGLMMYYPEQAEAILKKWSDEHPIVTNADKFREIFEVYMTTEWAQDKNSVLKWLKSEYKAPESN